MPHANPSPQRVFITGGADGLGRHLALLYAQRGADVAILDVDRDSGEKLAKTPGIRFHELDLADFEPENVDFGAESFDTVILNAGISAFGNFAEISWETQQAVLDVNLAGHLRLLHVLLGNDRLNPGGRLAFVLSAAAFTPIPVTATYAASKAALEGFGRSVEPWLMHRNISVSLIYPGQMQTAHLRKFYGNEDASAGVDPAIIARRVVRGLDRRARNIHPDAMSKIFRALATLAPWAMPRLIYRFNRKRFAAMLYPDLAE